MSGTEAKKRHRSPNGHASPFRSGNGWKVRPLVTFPDGSTRKVQGSGRTKADALAAAQSNASKALARFEAENAHREPVLTLAAAVERFLAQKASLGLAYKTLVAYRSALVDCIAPKIGEVPLDQVSYSMLSGLQTEVVAEKSSEVWRKVRTVIKQTLDMAVREGLLAANPATLLPSVKVNGPSRECLSSEQAAAVIEQARSAGAELRWLLALSTGMRQGECLGLRWSSVDLDSQHAQLIVREQLQFQSGVGLVLKSPKSAKSVRTIPLDPIMVTAFRRHQDRQAASRLLAGDSWQETGFVFTTRVGRPIRAEQDRDQWVRLLKAAGLDHVKLHSARHTAATLMFADQVPIYTVSRALGHSSISVTSDIYGHVAPAAVGDAVAGVASKITARPQGHDAPQANPMTIPLAAQLQTIGATFIGRALPIV